MIAKDRLPPKERVVAIFTEDETVVVPFSRLAREPVVQTDAGGRPVVVFYKRDLTVVTSGASSYYKGERVWPAVFKDSTIVPPFLRIR